MPNSSDRTLSMTSTALEGLIVDDERVERWTLRYGLGSGAYTYSWQIDAPEGPKPSGGFKGILRVDASLRVATVRQWSNQPPWRKVIAVEEVHDMTFEVKL